MKLFLQCKLKKNTAITDAFWSWLFSLCAHIQLFLSTLHGQAHRDGHYWSSSFSSWTTPSLPCCTPCFILRRNPNQQWTSLAASLKHSVSASFLTWTLRASAELPR